MLLGVLGLIGCDGSGSDTESAGVATTENTPLDLGSNDD